MHNKLQPSDLYTLEQYARIRSSFRGEVMAHKQRRTVQIGPNVTWIFEDRMTIQYQVQEMLRVERIFEEEGIADELNAYNPLIPDGSNWKATFLIEFTDVDERRAALARMKGIEDACWVQVDDQPRVLAIADEDMERSNDDKTSSVHFLRFELTAAMVKSAKAGAGLRMGIDHPAYGHALGPVPALVRESLVKDLL
ncbi:MAG: DUF3501 family protein [Steroidobacteraceae bacterium]